jgi:hypothetical protein
VQFYERAERCLEQAVQLEPERTSALECLGELVFTAIRFRRALPEWSAHKTELCERAHSAYVRLQTLDPNWRHIYWVAKVHCLFLCLLPFRGGV